MNLPNRLTLGRLVITAFFAASPLHKHPMGACDRPDPFLLIASATDWLGRLSGARNSNQITNFGKLMDPLADKVLVAAALVPLRPRASSPCRHSRVGGHHHHFP
jgi:phosphatidylglycerophosphate synthase